MRRHKKQTFVILAYPTESTWGNPLILKDDFRLPVAPSRCHPSTKNKIKKYLRPISRETSII